MQNGSSSSPAPRAGFSEKSRQQFRPRGKRNRRGGPPGTRYNPQFRDCGSPLTRRQAEVASAVLDGKSTDEIAAALGVDSSTVRGHLHTMYRQLGVSDRTQFIIEALKRGILEL
jgi:DNA-binding NarL/FixJ family response regulator